jgi:2-dehydropantoate 2-reductase
LRIIVFGIGAVGGVVAAALALAGHDVLGVARGTRLQAIRDRGLTLRSHRGTHRVPLQLVSRATDITPRPDDLILLVTKSQDTFGALADLRAAGFADQPIFCVQNGVANEDMALRLFPNVHGVNVMMPAEYLEADEAICFGQPNLGIFDIGRYPWGRDTADDRLAGLLTEAGVQSFVTETIMQNKYGKLLVNLGNIVQAVLGPEVAAPEIRAALKREGVDVLARAVIPWLDVGEGDPRRGSLLSTAPIDGLGRAGNSTTQSFLRRTGSVETDYLNGEIALIARLHGTEAPLNSRATALAARLARAGGTIGAMTPEALAAELGL